MDLRGQMALMLTRAIQVGQVDVCADPFLLGPSQTLKQPLEGRARLRTQQLLELFEDFNNCGLKPYFSRGFFGYGRFFLLGHFRDQISPHSSRLLSIEF